MRVAIAIFLLTAIAARAQFTTQQIAYLDARYGVAASGLTTNTDFGVIITGKYSRLGLVGYSTNTFARLAYRMNTRLSWGDFEPGHINDTDFSEAEVGAPLEFDWSDLE